jgi:hypothetical protein
MGGEAFLDNEADAAGKTEAGTKKSGGGQMLTEEVLHLPWQAILVLASGYAAYFLAYFGIRAWHKSVDTIFITLVFALIATGVLAALIQYGEIAAASAAFILTCGCAIIWRKYGRNLLHAALKKWDVSWSNDDPSALATLSDHTRFRISQIAVELDDGTWLECRTAGEFQHSPFGPFVIGPTGDVALYLTHETAPGKDEEEIPNVRVPDWGDRITYLPASRIRRISLRHKHI